MFSYTYGRRVTTGDHAQGPRINPLTNQPQPPRQLASVGAQARHVAPKTPSRSPCTTFQPCGGSGCGGHRLARLLTEGVVSSSPTEEPKQVPSFQCTSYLTRQLPDHARTRTENVNLPVFTRISYSYRAGHPQFPPVLRECSTRNWTKKEDDPGTICSIAGCCTCWRSRPSTFGRNA
jgi:hypothetical protein